MNIGLVEEIKAPALPRESKNGHEKDRMVFNMELQQWSYPKEEADEEKMAPAKEEADEEKMAPTKLVAPGEPSVEVDRSILDSSNQDANEGGNIVSGRIKHFFS